MTTITKKQSAPADTRALQSPGKRQQQNNQEDYTTNFNESGLCLTKEQSALWWLERDFLLLPVQPNSKKLVPGFGAYRDKITTPESVTRWFGEKSLANLAVCGTQTNFILDFDDADLYRSWARQFPDEAGTYTEQTPRGGFHVFARAWRRDLNGVELVEGVELKSVVLVAPSRVNNNPYTRGGGDLLDVDAPLLLSPLSKARIIPQGLRVGIHSSTHLQRIKAAYSCQALIESAQPGRKIPTSAKRFITVPCPFHDDKEPSFWIDTTRNLWGCHACGIRGDVINLYARLKGITNVEAIREMGESL